MTHPIDWQEFSGDVFRAVNNLSDALYKFEKIRTAISKKLDFIEKEKSERLGNLLCDAEGALMDIEEQFENFSAVGNFIDEELL
jgi:hypothetical protein